MTFWFRQVSKLTFTLAFVASISCGGPPPSQEHSSKIEIKKEPESGNPLFKNPSFPAAPLSRYSASHILFTHANSVPNSTSTSPSPSRDEALKHARGIHRKITDGASFESLAQNHSDDPSGKRGGRLGVFNIGTMIPLFEQAVGSVAQGEIAPLIETPFGFHIVRRDAIHEARASHVLVSHKEAFIQVHTRTKESAKARIWEAYNMVRQGTPFKEVSATYSDESADGEPGDLGLVGEGQMVPEFDRALFSLSIGQVSEPFETAYGYHIVLRRK